MLPIRDDNPTRRTPVVTVVLMAICAAVFLFVQPQESAGDGIAFSFEYAAVPCEIVENRPLTRGEVILTIDAGEESACNETVRPVEATRRPVFPDKRIWLAVVFSMFLHGSILHLAGNLLFLWVFGNNVEDHLGRARYLAFYVAAGAAATAGHVVSQIHSTVPVIGASGAIAGVMGAYLVWFPWARVRTIVILGIIPLWPRLPAMVPLAVWFVSQFFVGPDEGVAWVAHVVGFVFGAGVGAALRSDEQFRSRLEAHRRRVSAGGTSFPAR